MNKVNKRFKNVIAAVCICTAAICALCGFEETYGAERDQVSVIFTHDMHSHMDVDKKKSENGDVIEVGGFAKLKTAIDDVKGEYRDSFVVDGGDFSMGTPYQAIFSTDAPELKMMKLLGYDVVTLGNHEFDYRATGLAGMLEAALGKGPQMVAANVDWGATLADKSLKEDGEALRTAWERYGIKDYVVLERGGVKAAMFGLLGKSAVDYAPESGLVFKDATETAEKVVADIKKNEDVDMIICLSHCGTLENEEDVMEETEDYMLAETVPDIDLIISGHTHTELSEPVKVGDTYIVSCGSYNANMGHVVLEKEIRGEKEGRYELKSYDLIALDDGIKGNEAVDIELKKYKERADEKYFGKYGYSIGDKIAANDVEFIGTEDFGLVQGEEPLGNLIADSYKYAVAKAENGTIKGYEEGGVAFGEAVTDNGGAQIAVVPSGVVRGSLINGDIAVSDAFNISSLGYGKDGQTGYPLVRAYLTGKELKAVAEVDASVSNFMGVARLYSSGLKYSWNPNRLILNRAVDVMYDDGVEITKLENEKLYSVVADLYSCQMLGTVKDQSFGLLKIEPKDKDGNLIKDFEEHIIYDGDKEVKAWYALASYIDSFKGDEIPGYYGKTHGRKTEINSWNPAELFKQPNNIAAIAVAAVIVLVALIIGGAVLVRRRRKKSVRTD